MRNLRFAKPVVAASLLLFGAAAQSAIYKCIGPNGSNTFSDRPCVDATPVGRPSSANAASGDGSSHPADAAREKKAARVLDKLRIAAAEPESLVLQRTVDDAAPDLVKALDPDNGASR